MSRFVKDDRDDTSLQLVWHAPSLATPRPRCFLVAARDVPAGEELSMDYGPRYRRPWLANIGFETPDEDEVDSD